MNDGFAKSIDLYQARTRTALIIFRISQKKSAKMAKKQKFATPSHRAVGRVVRGLTYPIIAEEFDLTLRELNLLATIAHVNLETKLANGEALLDTFDVMRAVPGAGQAFWEEAQFVNAATKLEALGLATIKVLHGTRLFDPSGASEGQCRNVVLTKAGEELVDSMAGNLKKSLSLLDEQDVRDDLALYESV